VPVQPGPPYIESRARVQRVSEPKAFSHPVSIIGQHLMLIGFNSRIVWATTYLLRAWSVEDGTHSVSSGPQ